MQDIPADQAGFLSYRKVAESIVPLLDEKPLDISALTAYTQYIHYEAEGLIYTLQGRGSFVKGDAEAVRQQYLQAIDKSLTAAVEKGLAAGLNLSGLQKRLEEIYHEQCH